LAAGAALLLCAAGAEAQLRIATWNVTNYSVSGSPPTSTRDGDFKTAIYGVYQGRSMSPDVFVGQEFINASSVTAFRNLLNTAPGSPGDWASAPFFDGADTESAFFYRTSKVQYLRTVVVAVGSSSTDNQPRNTYRYDVRPIGYTSAGASLGIYSVHLKAQGGTNDAGRRLVECQRIRDNAQGVDTNPGFVGNPAGSTGLPAGWNFIVAGDLNITGSSAAEYQELVGSQANNTGRLFDPIATPGSWNNNSAFRLVHTQEQTANMDDRFDQLLVSAGLIDGTGLEYVGNAAVPYRTISVVPGQPLDNTRWNDPNHSYRVWGNDGTTYNGGIAVNQTVSNGVAVNRQNGMVGATIAQALINSAAGNGHLPVFADFRVPARVQTVASVEFGDVTIGSVAQRTFTVTNSGSTATFGAAGVSVLRYTLAMPSGFTTPLPGPPPAPPAAPPYWPPNPAGSFYHYAGTPAVTHTVTMNTATLGARSGVITLSAPGASETPVVLINVTGNVVPVPNQQPVADAGLDQTVDDCDGNGVQAVTLDGSGSTDTDGMIVEYRWSDGPTVLAQGASPTAVVGLAPGSHEVTLTVTDNGSATATDTVTITVTARPTANAGADATVTDADLSGDEAVTLNGGGSVDAEGPIAGYAWSVAGTPVAMGVAPTIVLPVGTTEVTLTVTDGRGCTDDDTVLVTVEPGATLCPADFDESGSVNPDDLADFIACFFTQPCPEADFDQNGGIDPDDLADFIAAYFTPCP
jgi:hypothetical protein